MEEANPTISVIITNYNYAQFVGGAIESVKGQSFKNIECIVVDDGSTDNSRRVIVSYDNIISIYQANQGQARAAKHAMRVAKGDIIMFLDSDDVLLPHACAAIASVWTPAIANIQFRLGVIHEDGSEGGTLPRSAFCRSDISKQFFQTGGTIYPPASGNAFSRDFVTRVFERGQGLDRRGGFDTWLCFAAAALGSVVSLDTVLGNYRVHSCNMSQAGKSRTISRVKTEQIYAYYAQQCAMDIAEHGGRSVTRIPHLFGPYYLKWYLLFRGIVVPGLEYVHVPLHRAVLVGLKNFWALQSISFTQRIANSILLPFLAVSPWKMRRFIATRIYGFRNDLDI